MSSKIDTSSLKIYDVQFSIHNMNQKLQPGKGGLRDEPINGTVNVPLDEFFPTIFTL